MKIPQSLSTVFEEAVKSCPRSSTKKNLHSDPTKEETLARLLNNVRTIFGTQIASQFQAEYESKNKGLSFLFAQITNAVVERAFHEGSCHAQAAYSLIELAKNNILNASLVCSRTLNLSTEHYYLLILEDHTYKILESQDDIIIKVGENRFNPESIFFDTWSNQLCHWSKFIPESPYTEEIRKTPQALFKSLLHLFGTEAKVIEQINWCLERYESILNSLELPEAFPLRFPDIIQANQITQNAQKPQEKSNDEDFAFEKECELLTSPQQCLEKLRYTIKLYKTEFAKLSNKSNESKLFTATATFFKQSSECKWLKYPENKLEKSKHKGNDVRCTKGLSTTEHTQRFFKYLEDEGFSTELVSTIKGPLILVDLTLSK